MSAGLAARLEDLDPEHRAIVVRWWRAHGLPRLSELEPAQARMVEEYVAWLTEPIPPTGPAAELPPMLMYPEVELTPPDPDAAFHVCGPDDYQQWLRPGEACVMCGLDPGFPIPDVDACHDRLVEVLGPDAPLWPALLARSFEEAR